MELLKFIIVLQLFISVELVDDTLVLIHVVARHCERTPDLKELHPRNPNYNENSFAPHGYGQLTNLGKRRCYEVGQALRQRYASFLDASYHYTLLEGRSSHYDRTKETIQLILAGLFPPTEKLIWREELSWIPIATKYIKKEYDEIVYVWGTDRHKKELAVFRQTEEYKNLTDQFKDVVEYVSQNYEDSLDFEKVAYLTRGFEVAEVFGKPIPEWLKKVYPNPLTPIMPAYVRSNIGSKRLLRISAGYFIKKIFEDSEMKINGTLEPSNRKLFLYAGHDITMIPILDLLDIWDYSTIPPPSSYFIFEIHNINGTYGFKFVNFHNSSEGQIVSIPGFGEFVPLNEFKIRKREFFDLDDLDQPSFSAILKANLLFVCLLPFLLLQITT